MGPDASPTDGTPLLRLWGVPEWCGAPPWVFSSERRFQLLAVLALQAGRWVERDRLAALLWPEREAAEARRNLRKVLHDTHALPGLQGLEVQAHALRWVVHSDVAAFRSQRESGDEAERATALAWRRAAPLLGLDDPRNGAYTDWLRNERTRLEEAWRDTALAHAQAQRNPAARAVLARRLLEVDALDEAAVTLLLQAEAAQGRAAEMRAEYQRYATRLASELGVEPAAALRDLVRGADAGTQAGASLGGAGAASAPAAAAVVAAGAAGFIGRRTELAAALAVLARPAVRALTLLGPGGVGKSSLALQLLPRSTALFPGGRFWVELHDAPTVPAALARIAQALGQPLKDTADPIAPLCRQLPAQRCLLVLDNAEHLAERSAERPAELAPLLQRLLAAAPQLVLLLTSRQRLALAGDEVLALAGLAVPDEDSRDLEAAGAFDAVRLFVQCAQAAQRGFSLQRHLQAVLTIVQAVGGMPLAIELAAGWVRLLPPEQVALDLQGSIELLERDPAAAGQPVRPEHSSLRAVLQGTWQLLAPQERAAIAALSVFCGGFTPAAARAVAGCSLPMLSSLVDKSLLAVDDKGRFDLHPVVAAFAAARLSEQAGTEAALDEPGAVAPALRQAHAEHFAQRLDELAPLLRTDQGRMAQAVLAEAANMRAAWHTAVALQRADLLYVMVPVLRMAYEVRGRLVEGLAELRPALQLAQPPRQRPAQTATEAPAKAQTRARALARVRHAVAMLHYRAGELAQAQAVAQAALVPAQACGELLAVAGCQIVLAGCAWAAGDVRAALRHYQRALALARRHGDRHAVSTALGNVGIAEKLLGRNAQALQHYEEALALARELGDRNATVVHLNNLGSLHRDEGRWAAAQQVLEEGLALCGQHGLRNMLPFVHLGLGLVQLERGRTTEAAAPLQQALAHASEAGLQQVRLAAEIGLAAVDIAQGDAAGREAGLVRLRRVARHVREGGGGPPLLVDAAYLYATALAAAGASARAMAVLALCAVHRGAEAARRRQALAALQALGGPPPQPVAEPELALQAVIDELLQTQPPSLPAA